jgi:hypothetical protein
MKDNVLSLSVHAWIVPDNLKSEVTKADKYEPFINE